MAMSEEEKIEFQKLLLSLLEVGGQARGNVTLMQELKEKIKDKFGQEISNDDYWTIRNPLVDEGILVRSRGKGGAVMRTPETQVQETELQKTKPKKKYEKKEGKLQKPFVKYLQDYWIKDIGVGDQIVVQDTANQGSKKTGGKWSRPDVSIAAVIRYSFTPGKQLEVLTFELKAMDEHDKIENVFECASHSVFSHRSYLALECPDGKPGSDKFERVETLCKRFGIGLMIFSDVKDPESFNEILEPERKNPDPKEIDNFIRNQFDNEKQEKLILMLR